MQRILCGLVTAAALSPAFAASEINMGVSSEYVFRGIPQSDGAQVWGSFDYYMESWGTYAGMWVSNAGLGGNEEVDVYAGYALTLGETLSLDFGGIGYFDPSAPESGTSTNSGEAYLGVNWGLFNSYGYYGFGTTAEDEDEYAYVEANYEIEVLPDARVRLHGGYFLGLGDYYDQFADDDYIDYGVSFIKDYGLAGQIALAVTATTIDANHGFTAIDGDLESDRPQFTVGWSRSFGSAF